MVSIIESVMDTYGRWIYDNDGDERWDPEEFRDRVFLTDLKEDRHVLTKKYFDSNEDVQLIFKPIIFININRSHPRIVPFV